jgi:hypothetical protein
LKAIKENIWENFLIVVLVVMKLFIFHEDVTKSIGNHNKNSQLGLYQSNKYTERNNKKMKGNPQNGRQY